MQDEKFKIAVVTRMKHGVLYEAIKKRGWTLKKAGEFLGIPWNTLCLVINLKKRPPFLFSAQNNENGKRKARELTEKLMELTNMTVEDLFPEAFRTDEFLDKPKVFERTAKVPFDKLLGYAEALALPPAPDEELMEKEDDEEVLDVVKKFPSPLRQDIQRVLFEGKEIRESAEERGKVPQTVRANIKSAKRRINETLQKRRRTEQILSRVSFGS